MTGRAMNTYRNRLMVLFLPIMISNLIGQVQMLIDRIFLGRMDILYMTAVGNASSALWMTMSVIYSLATGASILISQAVGEGSREKISKYSGSMFLYQNILPIVMFCLWMFGSKTVFTLMGLEGEVLEYSVIYAKYYSPIFLLCGVGSALVVCLQTSNYTKPLVLYGIIRSGINIFLDYALIFGKCGFPKMGIAGAALATTIAEFLGAVYISFVFVSNKRLETKPTFIEVITARIRPYLESVKLGINSAFEDFAWNLGNLLIIRILNSIDEKAAGIYSIVFSMELLSTVVVAALGSATVTLTGVATGAKNFKMYRKITGIAERWSLYVAGTALVLCCIFPKTLLGFFTTEPEVIAGSVMYLILVAINMFSKSTNIIIGSAIRGSGNTIWMLFTQCIGTVGVVAMASLFVYVFHWGMTGVFVAVLTDEGFRAGINLVKFLKIRVSEKEAV